MKDNKKEFKAYCNSVKCLGTRQSVRYVEKENAKKGAMMCPDCGFALRWSSEGKLKNRIVRNQKIKDRDTLY